MKIRSVLLGSAAIAGLTTAGYAADLGVVTSLDVCDQLGLSGLTISSDDNCLVITGHVAYEYDFGNYDPAEVYGAFANTTGNTYGVLNPAGHAGLDSNRGDVNSWLKFVGTANSDFGPATATIKLVSNNVHGTGNWNGGPGALVPPPAGSPPGTPSTVAINNNPIGIGEAWVGIGDTTMLMAGFKSSIFNVGDDAPLNYLGLFNSSSVNTGVGFAGGPSTGGDVIQVVSNFGNGLSGGAGLEGLGGASGIATAVGVLAYAGDGITAHISGAVDDAGAWKAHAGFTGSWDPLKVVAAVSGDSTGYWDALGSVAATFDMFTIAASGEATSAGEWGVGGSVGATITDGVSINLGGRYFHGTVPAAYNVYQVEAGISAAVTDTVTLTGAVGATDSTAATAVSGFVFYGVGGVKWAPGGGFTTGSTIQVDSNAAWKWVFTAAKDIK